MPQYLVASLAAARWRAGLSCEMPAARLPEGRLNPLFEAAPTSLLANKPAVTDSPFSRGKTMRKKKVHAIAIKSFALLVVLGTAYQAMAQDAATTYTKMAPVDQYLIADRDAEIALARSAAPESVSRDAEVMVMGRHGYEVAVQGKNGFVCVVERSWTAPKDHPDFWNPKLRAPICFNAPAARTYLPYVIKKTEWILAGQTPAQMFANIKAALDKKELPAMAPGAMCYMLSKQGHLGDDVGHWHPHLMFFVPQMAAQTWGADLPDSPVFSGVDPEDRLTVFLVPVGKWSDGTPDESHTH